MNIGHTTPKLTFDQKEQRGLAHLQEAERTGVSVVINRPEKSPTRHALGNLTNNNGNSGTE